MTEGDVRILKSYVEQMSWKTMPDFEGGHNWCFFLCIYWLRVDEDERSAWEGELVRSLENQTL